MICNRERRRTRKKHHALQHKAKSGCDRNGINSPLAVKIKGCRDDADTGDSRSRCRKQEFVKSVQYGGEDSRSSKERKSRKYNIDKTDRQFHRRRAESRK